MGYTDYSGPCDEILQSVKARLRADLAAPRVTKLVTAYFDPAGPFAAGVSTRSALILLTRSPVMTCSLSACWMSAGIPARYDGCCMSRLPVTGFLARIGPDTALWDAATEELRAADELWPVLCGLPGVQDAVASKLVARKRPHLAPITDSVIVTAVGTPGSTWPTLRRCFQDPEFRDGIEELRQQCPEGPGRQPAAGL